MKCMGSGNVLRSGLVSPAECLHSALSLPTSVGTNGCESTGGEGFRTVRNQYTIRRYRSQPAVDGLTPVEPLLREG